MGYPPDTCFRTRAPPESRTKETILRAGGAQGSLCKVPGPVAAALFNLRRSYDDFSVDVKGYPGWTVQKAWAGSQGDSTFKATLQ